MNIDYRGFDTLPAQVWVAAPEGALTYVNPAVVEYFCTAADKLLNEGWQSVCHPKDLPEVLKRWRASLASGKPYEAQFRLRRGTESQYRWHVARAAAHRNESGAIALWIGINTEIDEVKRAEEVAAAQIMRARRDAQTLREARKAAEALAAERTIVLNQLAEGVIITDASGAITFINRYAEKLHGCAILGVPPDGYAPTYQLLTIQGAPYPSMELPLARAVRGEAVLDAVWKIRRQDGTEITAIGSAVPVFDDEGNQVGAVITMRDAAE